MLTTAIAVATCPITTWWLLGDLSESPTAEDYILKAPELTGDHQLAIGFVATPLFIVAVYVIAIALHAQHITWVELHPVLPLLLAGIFCGFGWRVVTAGALLDPRHSGEVGGPELPLREWPRSVLVMVAVGTDSVS